MFGNQDRDTICALATPGGTSALALIRMSGPDSIRIARLVFPSFGEHPESHRARFGKFLSASGAVIDEVVGTYFAQGNSFTGEASVEWTCHGNPLIVSRVLSELVGMGAKLAGPGEFTYRAFMNGKLDLIQAEAILGLIEAQSVKAASISREQLAGALSKDLQKIKVKLLHSLAHLEANIDFVEEGIVASDYADLMRGLVDLRGHLEKLAGSHFVGRIFQDGLRVAILGKPNVGKSSLLNLILSEDKAIVSPIAGTTRDLVDGVISVDGCAVRFIDTAGIRVEIDDEIEKIGVARALDVGQKVDLIFFVFNLAEGLREEDLDILKKLSQPISLVVLGNQVDRFSRNHGEEKRTLDEVLLKQLNFSPKILFVSAKNNEDRSSLLRVVSSEIERLKNEASETQTLIHHRQYQGILEAKKMLDRAIHELQKQSSPDLISFEVRSAWTQIQELLGEKFDDQILSEIFSQFCIGK